MFSSFTNFEMEHWAYKIINAAEKNTNMLAIETGKGAFLLPFNEEEGNQEEKVSQFDPHIWLDMDNAQKMVDNIAEAFIKKDSRNSDYYLKNAHNYKLKLMRHGSAIPRRINRVQDKNNFACRALGFCLSGQKI